MLRNIFISVLVAAAAAVSAVIVQNDNSVVSHDVIVSDVCVVSSVAVPAVPEVTTNISVSDIVVSSAACEPSAVPAVTSITTFDTVPDTNVSDIVIIAENSVVSAAVPETVNDAENNNNTIVSDNTDTNVSNIQDDANNADMYNIDNLYALYTVVSDINYNDDIVYCTDFNNNIWSFYGVDDWFINDICSMIMYDNNTSVIYDDIIIDCTYSGYIEIVDNIDISENADIIPDENTLFTEYLNAISNGDYIE